MWPLQNILKISVDLFLILRTYYCYLAVCIWLCVCFFSIHNTIKNYAKWQLLHNEYNIFAPFLANKIEAICKTDFEADFAIPEALSLGCAVVVETFMPLAIARPFVNEFITEQSINKVNWLLMCIVHTNRTSRYVRQIVWY